MKNLIIKTDNISSPLFLRIFLAIVLFPHGAQKLFGWFGGYGFEGTMNYFTGTVGLPWIVGFLVILVEFFAPLALILGIGTRVWSAAIFGLMLGIVWSSHHDYFFMNWYGSQKAEGMEYFLLVLGMSASLVVSGSGRLSLDKKLYTSKKQVLVHHRNLAATA